MAPSRKSRSVHKRFSYINDVSHNKSGENGNKSRQKVSFLFLDHLYLNWLKHCIC
uniref:Protein ALWAYS EARLY 3 isoform X1 n=1 Tax=Rhizophora mucronata TaxID=61149 RepID=A0A2P2KWT4_RHIMU